MKTKTLTSEEQNLLYEVVLSFFIRRGVITFPPQLESIESICLGTIKRMDLELVIQQNNVIWNQDASFSERTTALKEIQCIIRKYWPTLPEANATILLPSEDPRLTGDQLKQLERAQSDKAIQKVYRNSFTVNNNFSHDVLNVIEYLYLNRYRVESLSQAECTSEGEAAIYGRFFADIYKAGNLRYSTTAGTTLLNVVAALSNSEVARNILKNTSLLEDINKRENGYSAVCFAVAYRQYDMVETFCQFEADLGIIEKFDRAPMHLAVRYGDIQMVQLLAKCGADIDILNYGVTPLNIACLSNDLQMIKELVEMGAKILSTELKRSPLYWAHLEGKKVLLETYAKTQLLSLATAIKEGQTIQHIEENITAVLSYHDVKYCLRNLNDKMSSEIFQSLIDEVDRMYRSRDIITETIRAGVASEDMLEFLLSHCLPEIQEQVGDFDNIIDGLNALPINELSQVYHYYRKCCYEKQLNSQFYDNIENPFLFKGTFELLSLKHVGKIAVFSTAAASFITFFHDSLFSRPCRSTIRYECTLGLFLFSLLMICGYATCSTWLYLSIKDTMKNREDRDSLVARLEREKHTTSLLIGDEVNQVLRMCCQLADQNIFAESRAENYRFEYDNKIALELDDDGVYHSGCFNV